MKTKIFLFLMIVNLAFGEVIVFGKSDLKIKPDSIILTMDLKNTAKNLSKAKLDNDNLIKNVNKILKDSNVTNVEISGISYSKHNNYNDKGWIIGSDFEASKQIKARLKASDNYNLIVSNLISSGVESLNLEFKSSNENKELEKAIENAILSGKEKAYNMAKTLNKELGEIIEIEEISSQSVTPVFYRSQLKSNINSLISINAVVKLKFDLK